MADLCRGCGKTEPEGGWHLAGYSDGEMEFYCSDACLDDDLNGHEEEYDPGEECGRWDQNAKGGMSPYCRLAGTEFCDWECPYSH